MGAIRKHLPVKLVCGFISRHEKLFDLAEKLLIRRYGSLDFSSAIISFNHTVYYEKELGTELLRKFISFSRLTTPEVLVDIKRHTNALEKKLSEAGKRRINIDPGYLTDAKVILASTKDFSHRIYLGKGIFADGTLCFRGDSFQSWPWTFPDFRTEEYIAIFNDMRACYLNQKRNEKTV